jgi:hypothetical protein
MKNSLYFFCSLLLLAISSSAWADPRGGQWCTFTYCSGVCSEGETSRTWACSGITGNCESAIADACQIERQDFRHKFYPEKVCGRYLKNDFYRECEGYTEIPSK